MEYKFDSRVALIIGVNPAIILEHLYGLHEYIKNTLSSYCSDDEIYLILSDEYFLRTFYCISNKQIKKAISILNDNELIKIKKKDELKYYYITNNGMKLLHHFDNEYLWGDK